MNADPRAPQAANALAIGQAIASQAIAGLAIAGLAAASPAAAQEPPVDAPFGEVIDVELVNIRVWVSDRQGRQITGLGVEDFTVEVDGEPVEITHFSESRRGEIEKATEPMSPAPDPVAEIDAARPEAAAEPPIAATPEVRSRFVFYLDELHLSSLGRGEVIEELRRLVKEQEIPPEDLLILQQATDLRRVLPFGSSAEEVDAALESLLEPPGGEIRATRDKQLAVRRMWQLWENARQLTDRDPCRTYSRDGEREAVIYAQRAAAIGRVTLRHLEEVSSFLAGLEGFKALLYVGDLLEVRPGEDLMQIVSNLCPRETEALPGDILSEELSTTFDEVAQRANAGQVTFYTLQASGLRAGGYGGADQRSSDVRVAGAFERASRLSGRAGHEQLALETGGEAFFNRGDFGDVITEVAEDLESFYSLGFPPPGERSAAGHRLKVKVRGSGLQVRHRDRIQLRSTRQRMVEQVMSAIHLGESQNPLGVRLASGALRQESENVMTLPLFVRVPIEAITFLPGADGAFAELEVMVAARSPEHQGMPPVTRGYRLQHPGDGVELLDLAMELQLAPGVYVLGLGVRDRVAGTKSFISTSIAVGPVDEP